MRWYVLLSCLLALGATAHAESPKPTASGNFYAPQFSPDGQHLLVTGERLHGLKEIHLTKGSVRSIVDAPRVGSTAHYLADGRVAFAMNRAGKERHLAMHSDGSAEEIYRPEPRAFAHGNRIYLRSESGLQRVGSGDRFFAPIMSADGSKVAFTGLATGIHVYDLTTKTLTHVGPGTAPSWSPDGSALAYERTQDDGHHIVASDVWLWNAQLGSHNLSASDTLIERRPSWSPDGKRIAFDDDSGSVYIVTLPAER